MNPKHRPVFERLCALYRGAAEGCAVKTESESELIFIGPEADEDGKEVWLGGVQWKKRYVSVHVFPVYVEPRLLEDTSEALRKRQQGKSCFNFTRIDEALFDELDALVRRGIDHFRQTGRLG